MIKRFIIAAIIVGLFLGGVGYFNLVFKPQMIGEFMKKMVPPPATVTAEPAKTDSWTNRLHSIGTLIAIKIWHELPAATKKYIADVEQKQDLTAPEIGLL